MILFAQKPCRPRAIPEMIVEAGREGRREGCGGPGVSVFICALHH